MIRELPNFEKPREKALKYGLRSLSTRELLALVIRHGTNGCSALDLAEDIITKTNGLKGLGKANIKDLCEIKGISKVKALELLVPFEIARRASEEEVSEVTYLDNPEKIVNWLKKEIGYEAREHFLVVFLDTSFHIINYKCLFIGTSNASLVYPRDILKEAILLGSTQIILAHNHPSGTLIPSEADIAITEKIIDAAKLMDIRVVDHIIVTSDGYLSFARQDLLNND